MSIHHNAQGKFKAGNLANPSGRPKTTLASVLKDQNQRKFLEIFYPLLSRKPEDLKELAKDPNTAAIDRFAVKIIIDSINGNHHQGKLLLSLLGFDMRNPQVNMHIARYLVTEDGAPPIDVEELDQTNVHAQVVRLIKDVGSKNGNR